MLWWMTPELDHQPVTISFLWCMSRFRQCFDGLSSSSHCDERLRNGFIEKWFGFARNKRKTCVESLVHVPYVHRSIHAVSTSPAFALYWLVPNEPKLFTLFTLLVIHVYFGSDTLPRLLSRYHYPPALGWPRGSLDKSKSPELNIVNQRTTVAFVATWMPNTLAIFGAACRVVASHTNFAEFHDRT